MICLFHKWNGCKCSKCGKVRDKEHNFETVSGKCNKVCSICGKEGHKYHKYQFVSGKCIEICSICGEEGKIFNHNYQPVSGVCQEKCSVCGDIQTEKHLFENGKCKQCGVDINAPIKHEAPPLIIAAREGNVEEVYKLINAGANVNVDRYGKNYGMSFGETETPILVAAKGFGNAYLEIVALLIKHGADINATDFWGLSAVAIAHRSNNSVMVELLTKCGGEYISRKNSNFN